MSFIIKAHQTKPKLSKPYLVFDRYFEGCHQIEPNAYKQWPLFELPLVNVVIFNNWVVGNEIEMQLLVATQVVILKHMLFLQSMNH